MELTTRPQNGLVQITGSRPAISLQHRIVLQGFTSSWRKHRAIRCDRGLAWVTWPRDQFADCHSEA